MDARDKQALLGISELSHRERQEWIRALEQGSPREREIAELARFASLDGARAPEPAADPAQVALSEGDLVFDRYRVQRGLGAGGASTVYEAFDLQERSLVALKVASRSSSRSADRLAREFERTHSISIPGVRRARRLVADERVQLLVLEHLAGRDLAEHIAAGPSLQPDNLLAIALRLTATLAAIHRAGVVHGDLKPENVIVDEAGQPWIIDFAYSNRIDESGSDLAFGGTPQYLAPERLDGSGPTTASDVYALALMLLEIFRGRRVDLPLDSPSDDDLEPLVDEDAGPEGRLMEAIGRGLSPDPDDRPAASELHRILSEPDRRGASRSA